MTAHKIRYIEGQIAAMEQILEMASRPQIRTSCFNCETVLAIKCHSCGCCQTPDYHLVKLIESDLHLLKYKILPYQYGVDIFTHTNKPYDRRT